MQHFTVDFLLKALVSLHIPYSISIFDLWPFLCYLCFRESPGSTFEVYMEVVHSGTAGSGKSSHSVSEMW